jgi:protein SCO1/2
VTIRINAQQPMLRAALLVVVAVALAACQPQKFNSVDITGSSIGPDFSLTDHTGAKRTLADFRGKVVVLFFGFMNCPDVCPTTLSEMAAVKKKLGRDGDRVQVIFVTLDPERDTAALLAQYVPAFDPTFLGLRGSAEETAAVAKDFKIFYQKVPGAQASAYTLDHTAASFVFDPEGRIRLFVSYGMKAELIAADIKRLQ